MRRLYTSESEPGLGAVTRDLSTGKCLATGVVGVISGVGCSPDFPVQDNEYGKLPTTFPLDVEIDTEDFDVRLEALNDISYSTLYPDMWGLLDSLPILQADVLAADCYCPGDGMLKPGLTTGRPTFPVVNPLPFFWFPALDVPPQLTVREFNPDETLPGDCCPTDQVDHIKAEIIGNEIQLQHVKKGDLEERYRTNDTHHTFQARAGFPKWCCGENDCYDSTDPGLEPTHVLKWLHFPRYPSEDRDPYDETTPEEPLAYVPFIPDIQCDPATGILHVYHAAMVIHDGTLAGLQWDIEPPRDAITAQTPELAPTNPLDLPINEDYQGNEIYPVDTFKPIAPDEPPLGSTCDENCDQAFANMLRPEETCEPLCPQDGVICTGDLGVGYIGEGTGPTPGDANSAAVADLLASIPASCEPIQIIWICFTVYDEDLEEYRANVKGCCPE